MAAIAHPAALVRVAEGSIVPRSAEQGAIAAYTTTPGPFRTAPKRRHRPFRLIGFVLIVIVPVCGAAVYLFGIAADQYVAEFRFALRSAAPAPVEPAAALWHAAAASSQASLDAAAVVQFIESRAIIDELDPQLDLRSLFSRPEADWPARLSLPVSIEELVRYWRSQVEAYDAADGTVIVRVRAFTPQDALAIARGIAGASEKLVNTLSERAREDTLRHAQEDVADSERRLQAALGKIREFRDRQGVIDPAKTAEASSTLVARVRDELLRARAERATLKTYMRDDAPSLKVLDARIRALEAQSHAVAGELTASDSKATPAPLSKVMGTYEELEGEKRFAETAYQHALEALDRSRGEADRQQIYLASFVPPSLPEEALYPRRLRSVGIVALVAFALWAVGCLVLQSVRDHL
ncbi:MAG: hypothetical protein JO305_00415 [Alphaproteobacteria bacterium]|nr:hypothetical protein [Alphaproteobacteria bacterium]